MFTPARFIVDESYARRTCGMERTLLAQLRAAAAVDRQSLEMCCWKLQAQMKSRTGREVVVMVAPPIGKPLCVAGDGSCGEFATPAPPYKTRCNTKK